MRKFYASLNHLLLPEWIDLSPRKRGFFSIVWLIPFKLLCSSPPHPTPQSYDHHCWKQTQKLVQVLPIVLLFHEMLRTTMMYLASGGGAPAATTGPAKVHVSNTTSAATFAAPTIGVPAGSHQEVPPRQGGEGSTSSDESFVYVRGASDCDSPSPPLGTERQQQQTESLTVALGGDGPTTIAFDAKGEETRNTPIADKAEERIAAKPEIVATIVVAESATDAEAELVEFLASLDMASLADTLHKHGVRSLEALFAIATDDSPQGKAAYKAVVTQAGPRTRLKTAVVSKAKHSEPLQVALNSTKQNAEENSPSETKSNARVAAEEAGAGAGEKALTMAQDVTETAAPEPNGPAVEETKHVVHAAEADVAPSAAQADIPSPSPSPSSPLDAFYRRFTGDTASPVAARVAAAYLSGSCPLLGDEKEPTAQPSEKAPHVAEEDRAPEAAQLNDEVARAAAQEAAMQQRAREEEENQRRRVAEEEAVKKRVESLSLPLRTLFMRAGLTFDEQVDIAATGIGNATALRELCNSDPALRAVLTDAASRERLLALLETAEEGIRCASAEEEDRSKWRRAHNEVAMSSALLLLLDTQGAAWSVDKLGGSLGIEMIETLRDLCHEPDYADDFAGAFPDANERRQLTAAVDSAITARTKRIAAEAEKKRIAEAEQQRIAEEARKAEAARIAEIARVAAAEEAERQQRAREEEENQRRRVAEEEAVKKRVESLSLPLRTLFMRAGLTFDEQVDIAATGIGNATALRELCNSDPALRAVLTDAASRERLRGLLKTAEDGIYCAESEKADQSKWQAHNEVAMSSALLLLLDTQGVAWSVERLAGGSLEIELIETLRDLCHEQNAADDFAGAFPDANERRQLTAAVDSALASRKDTAALKEFLCSESLKMGPLVGTLPNHGVRSLEALFALARDDSPQGRSAFGKVVTKLGWRGDLKKAAAACTSNASSRTADKKADPPSQQQQHAVEKLSPCLAEFLTRRDLKDLAERLLRADVMNLSTLFGLALEDNGASERFKTVVPFALRAKICLEAKAAQAAGGVPTATTTTTTAVTAPPAKGPQADLAALLEKAKATEWAATLDIEGGVHTIADLELIALDEKHSVLWKGLVTEDAARGRIEEELFTLRRGATRAPARPSPAVLSPSHPAPTLSAKGRPQQSAAQKQKTALQTPPPTAANGHQQQVTTAQAPSQTANDDKPTLSAKGRPQHGKAAPQAETQPAAVPPAQTLPQKTLRAAGRSAAPAAMPQRPAQRSNSDVAAVAAADPPRSPRPKKGMTAAQRRNMRNATPTAPLVDDDYSYYDAYSSAAPAAAAAAAALHAEGDAYASRSVYAFDEASEAPLFVDGENNLANDIEAQRALEATFAAGLAIAAEEAAVFGMTVEEYMLVQRQNEASLALALQLSRE